MNIFILTIKWTKNTRFHKRKGQSIVTLVFLDLAFNFKNYVISNVLSNSMHPRDEVKTLSWHKLDCTLHRPVTEKPLGTAHFLIPFTPWSSVSVFEYHSSSNTEKTLPLIGLQIEATSMTLNLLHLFYNRKVDKALLSGVWTIVSVSLYLFECLHRVFLFT